MNINAFDSLTPEQEAMIPKYIEFYESKFFIYKPIDREKATEFFQWLYEFSGLQPFKDLYIVSSQVAAQKLANELMATKDIYYPYAGYGNSYDLSWLCYFSFMRDVVGNQELDKNFDKYHEIIDLNIYDCIQFDEAVILVELPTEVYRSGTKLHREDGPAIKFGDGYEAFFWNGVEVPEKLIMNKESITKEDILLASEEVQQCFLEALGEDLYLDIITS